MPVTNKVTRIKRVFLKIFNYVYDNAAELAQYFIYAFYIAPGFNRIFIMNTPNQGDVMFILLFGIVSFVELGKTRAQEKGGEAVRKHKLKKGVFIAVMSISLLIALVFKNELVKSGAGAVFILSFLIGIFMSFVKKRSTKSLESIDTLKNNMNMSDRKRICIGMLMVTLPLLISYLVKAELC